MGKFRLLLRIIDGISDWMGKVTSFLMTAIIIVMLYSVVRQHFFGIPWMEYVSITSNYFALYIFLGGAYVFHAKAFVNVDILQRRLSVRRRAVIDMVTAFCFFAYCSALTSQIAQTALSVRIPKAPISLSLLLAPGWLVNLLLPTGMFVLLLAGLAKFVRDLITVATGSKIP